MPSWFLHLLRAAGYMQHVLLPVLRKRLGISVHMKLDRRGFFPRGQGHVQLTAARLAPGTCLPAIDLTNRGEIVGMAIRAFTAGRLVPTIGERLAAAAQKGARCPVWPGLARLGLGLLAWPGLGLLACWPARLMWTAHYV